MSAPTNMKKFGKVAVLMGGPSAEREVSLKSGAAVLAGLTAQGVDAHGIDADRDVLNALERDGFDRAFIILHGPWGEDGVMQGALELRGIPYTGSGVMASALSMDKLRSRYVLAAAGLPVPPTMVLGGAEDFEEAVADIGLPMAVKPNTQGSSIGVSKVRNAADLPAAFDEARKYDAVVLAERWIKGQELCVAILGGEALPVIRIEAVDGVYDYEAKYVSNATQYHCPAGLTAKHEKSIQALALDSFQHLGCTGWGRVDILLDEKSKPYVLEMNTLPGMTDHSLVPMAAKAAGISFDELVVRILEVSDD